MAVGDIVLTSASQLIVEYAPLKSGETPTDGQPVALDSNGELVKAVDTIDGPIYYLTHLRKTIGSTTYYGFLKRGRIVSTAGGALKKGMRLKVTSASKLVQQTKGSVSATPTQAEIQAIQNEFWRFAGIYVCKESDVTSAAGTGIMASTAADTNPIVVEVGTP